MEITEKQLEDIMDAAFLFLVKKVPPSNLFSRVGIDVAHVISKNAAEELYSYLVEIGVIAKS